jgi:hypothetical protein
MPGSMNASDVKNKVDALQAQYDSAKSPADLDAVRKQADAFKAQLAGEVDTDTAATSQAAQRARDFENQYAQSNQTQYANKANDAWLVAQSNDNERMQDMQQMNRLGELLGKIKGRAMVAQNPELENKLAGPLAGIQAKLKSAGVPDEAAAAMLSTIESKGIQPEKAAAAFMVMRGHISHESGVPQDHINDIAAGLAVTQVESNLPPEQIQESFHFFLNVKNEAGEALTTPANAQALVSAYTNRLADLAGKQNVTIDQIKSEDAVAARDALKSDYAHFVHETEGDGAIAALLAGAVTDKADRAEVWKQYRFFDDQNGIESVQAAVLTAGMMSRVTDVADIQTMRQDVLTNYHDIMNMKAPDNMQGATISPMVAAGYAGAGLGPRVVVVHDGPTFGDLMLYSWFMSSHPVYGYGYYGSYSSGYSAGYWAGRTMASPSYTSSYSSYRSSFGTPAAMRPPPAISSLSSLNRVAASPTGATSFGTRATTGAGAIGSERLNLGQGIGRNTTVLSPTGMKSVLAPQATRAPGGGLGSAATAGGGLNLGAGVGRTSTVGSASRWVAPPSSTFGSSSSNTSSSWGSRVGGGSFSGISG